MSLVTIDYGGCFSIPFAIDEEKGQAPDSCSEMLAPEKAPSPSAWRTGARCAEGGGSWSLFRQHAHRLSAVQSACCERGDALLGGLVFRAGLLLPILRPMQRDNRKFERLQTCMTVFFQGQTRCTV